MPTKRMKNGNNGEFLLGSLDANVKTILTTLQKVAEVCDSREKDSDRKFAGIHKHIWIVVGMGILIVFMVSLASLVIQIRKAEVPTVQYGRSETTIERIPAEKKQKP